MNPFKLTFQEIIDILKKYEVSIEEFAFESIQKDLKDTIQLETGIWEEIDQVGGEGEGDYWHSVKHFKDSDIYIKIIGFYSSYIGVDFGSWENDCIEVKPKEKIITVYDSI